MQTRCRWVSYSSRTDRVHIFGAGSENPGNSSIKFQVGNTFRNRGLQFVQIDEHARGLGHVSLVLKLSRQGNSLTLRRELSRLSDEFKCLTWVVVQFEILKSFTISILIFLNMSRHEFVVGRGSNLGFGFFVAGGPSVINFPFTNSFHKYFNQYHTWNIRTLSSVRTPLGFDDYTYRQQLFWLHPVLVLPLFKSTQWRLVALYK